MFGEGSNHGFYTLGYKVTISELLGEKKARDSQISLVQTSPTLHIIFRKCEVLVKHDHSLNCEKGECHTVN